MSNSNFSEGKWYLESQPKGTGRGFETTVVTDKQVIATMVRDTCSAKGVLKYSKTAEANAKLIASAPLLLEALQHVKRMIEQNNIHDYFDNPIIWNAIKAATT